MPANTSTFNITGSFPVLNNITSYTDAYGAETITYTITNLQSVESTLAIGQEYYGPTNTPTSALPVIPTFQDAYYLITNYESQNINGGLRKETITTIGLKENRPKVEIRSGYPFILGLGVPAGLGENRPNKKQAFANKGLGVVLTFVKKSNTLDSVYAIGGIMPTSYEGISLPTPRYQPYNDVVINIRRDNQGNEVSRTTETYVYKGYTCIEINLLQRGGVNQYQYVYAEGGSYRRLDCFRDDAGAQTCTETVVYSYN